MVDNNSQASAEKVEQPRHMEIRVDPEYDLSVLTAENAEFLASFSQEARKRAVRKVDIRLVPILAFLYLVSYTDRANIGNAAIEGLNEDLSLDGVKYNIALCVFFVPYILCEIPTNWIVAKIRRPSKFLGAMVLLWGIITTLTGFVQNFAGLVATRVVLGFLEAGLFPGAIYLISEWYLPNETQTRIAIFYCASAASGAFSGLLAFAIAKMDGIGGYSAWRWIFIIEGAASILCCALAFFIMPDSPGHSSSFLSADEIRFLQVRQLTVPGRHNHDQEQLNEKFRWSALLAVLANWQTYLLVIVSLSATGPAYALKFTMPRLIKNMGYESSMAQILTIPPYTCGVMANIASAWVADRITWRMPFAIGADILIIIAHAVLYTFGPTQKEHIPTCYFALCLACMGIYPIAPTVNAWLISNTAPQTKRAMTIGYFTGLSNIGGIFGSFIYRQSEAPTYPTGYATAFSLACGGVISSIFLEYTYARKNKKRALVDEDEVRAKYSEEELDKLGDGSPLFRYSY